MVHLILTMNLTIINTAIVKRMDLLEYYDSRQNILDIERNTLFLLSEELKRFKKEKGLKDFNDLQYKFFLHDSKFFSPSPTAVKISLVLRQ